MKLYRSDLEQLISNQLFEISTDDLDLIEFKVEANKLFCTVSVETAANGYRIHGKDYLKESIDDRLIINEKISSNVTVILSNNKLHDFKDNKAFLITNIKLVADFAVFIYQSIGR